MSAPETLPRLAPSGAPRPRAGIVHLGLGAFVRAHGVLYTAEAMDAAGADDLGDDWGADWGIIGVSLRRPDIRDALAPQGFAYTAVELGPEGRTARLVETVRDVLVAPENPDAVLDALADPAIRLVTLTITEKGYGHRPATGALDPDQPDIAHDIARTGDTPPRSAAGVLVEALARRRAAGLAPFTVMSCDNLPDNGRVTRAVVTGLAERRDPALAAWIAQEGAFPSSMVDRIVPATTPDDIARLAAETGRFDAAPVMHEPFRQWVIEDRFVGGARPRWELAGAQLVAEVAPFEAMKLRCLNGSHSALAYLGYLSGHETIGEAVADPALAAFVRRLWRDEVIPSLEAPPGTDLAAYCEALMTRYRNPAIRHRTWQIAMDGSQKLPQRLLGTVRDNLAAGRPIAALSLAVAAWMAYVSGRDEAGRPIDVRDPLAAQLAERANGPDPVGALLGLEAVFGPLGREPRFAQAVAEAHETLAREGVRAALSRLG